MDVKLLRITENPIELIYKAYRTCYTKFSYEDIKTKEQWEMIEFIKDKIDKNHLTPLEHVYMTFSINGISRACQNQLVRHRLTSPNVKSQRYVNEEKFQTVVPDTIQLNDSALVLYKSHILETQRVYKQLVDMGIPIEDARSVLPNSTKTNMIISCNLRELRNLLSLRLCSHAQIEIKNLAFTILSLLTNEIPFLDYKLMHCGRSCNGCSMATIGEV